MGDACDVSSFFVSVCLLVAFRQCLFYVGSPGRESCRLPVYKAKCRCCGSPARFSGSAFQQICHFLVRQQFISIRADGCRCLQHPFDQGQQPVEIRVERLYPLVVLFSDFITSYAFDIGYTLFLKLVQMVLPFQTGFLTFVLHVTDYSLHIVRTVVQVRFPILVKASVPLSLRVCKVLGLIRNLRQTSWLSIHSLVSFPPCSRHTDFPPAARSDPAWQLFSSKVLFSKLMISIVFFIFS